METVFENVRHCTKMNDFQSIYLKLLVLEYYIARDTSVSPELKSMGEFSNGKDGGSRGEKACKTYFRVKVTKLYISDFFFFCSVLTGIYLHGQVNGKWTDSYAALMQCPEPLKNG